MWLLVTTFYSGDEMVGVDVEKVEDFVHPVELMTKEILAPSNSDFAVVSLSHLEKDEFEWIVPFGMVRADGESN